MGWGPDLTSKMLSVITFLVIHACINHSIELHYRKRLTNHRQKFYNQNDF